MCVCVCVCECVCECECVCVCVCVCVMVRPEQCVKMMAALCNLAVSLETVSRCP